MRTVGKLGIGMGAIGAACLIVLLQAGSCEEAGRAEPVRVTDAVPGPGTRPSGGLLPAAIESPEPRDLRPSIPEGGDSVETRAVPGLDLTAELEALVERLDAAARDGADSFPERARDELERAHQLLTGFEAEARRAALLPIVDRRSPHEPVGQALLVLLGAWGGGEPVALRCGLSGPSLQAALVGCGWALETAAPASAIPIDPASYSRFSSWLGPVPVAAVLSRPLPPVLRPLAIDLAMGYAEDRLALQDRDLAILALGVSVDLDPDVLDLFASVLLDPERTMVQARPAICFVLARSRSDPALSLLRQFLADPQLGSWGKGLAGLWLAEAGGDPIALQNAAETLFDDDSDQMERTLALGVVSKRLHSPSPEESALVVELLCMVAVREKHYVLRHAALSFLGDLGTGDSRMDALSAALRSDALPKVRRAAALALGQTVGADIAEARRRLEAARLTETDPIVLEAIDQALLGLSYG